MVSQRYASLCSSFCHSERGEESRIFLDANQRNLNHGSTAPPETSFLGMN